MLKLKHALKRLMKLLRSIDPTITLPEFLETILGEQMDEIYPKHHEVLVYEGDVPKHAYYIIRGYVYVYYDDDKGMRHVVRFYREDRIVAFLEFLKQEKSLYTIAAGKDTILSQVSIGTMKDIYKQCEDMYEFAQLVVLRYDSAKVKFREDLLGMPVAERIAAFYAVYPFLLPADSARMDEAVASFLKISTRTLQRHRP